MVPPQRADLYRLIWQWRQEEGARWSDIAARLDLSEPALARLRVQAIADGAAVKDPVTGRVAWLPPGSSSAAVDGPARKD